MALPDFIRDSKALRRPLLVIGRFLLSQLTFGPALFRRAAYDAMPIPYLVTGHPEHFVVATSDKVIGRELFLHGEFDFHKLQLARTILIREGLQPPSHLVDVGANIGTILIPAIKRGLVNSATAVEPHPANLRLLHANLALNDILSKVNVLAVAVGDSTGDTLRLKESATNSGNHSIDTEGIPVSSMRLDDLEIPPNSLLWMDIEGYEGHALMGAMDLLAAGMPVVCEYNPSYLLRSGGLPMFQKALLGRRIFDLKGGSEKEITLEELVSNYPDGPDFTDILAIPAGAA